MVTTEEIVKMDMSTLRSSFALLMGDIVEVYQDNEIGVRYPLVRLDTRSTLDSFSSKVQRTMIQSSRIGTAL